MATAIVSGVYGRGRGRGRGLRAAASIQKPGPTVSTQNISKVQEKPSADTSQSKLIVHQTVTSEHSVKNNVIPVQKSASEQLCIDAQNSEESKPERLSTSKQNSTSPEANNDNTSTVVSDIIKRMYGLTESEVMKIILPEIELIKSKETLEDLIKALTESALLDAKFAFIAAKLSNKIWNNESLHAYIRNPLLKQTQMNFTNRNQLLKENKFHGLCVYICELFKYLRVKQQPLRPVGEAVVQLLKELMEKSDTPTEEDIFYFYQELESAGSVIEECFPEKMEEVINIARQMIISTTLLPSMKCRLVQLVELHAAKWKMKDELKIMYDNLQQELISEAK